MYDIIRDAPLGQAIRWISGNKYLQYPEEAPDLELLPQYRLVTEDDKTSQPLGSDLSRSRTKSSSLVNLKKPLSIASLFIVAGPKKLPTLTWARLLRGRKMGN